MGSFLLYTLQCCINRSLDLEYIVQRDKKESKSVIDSAESTAGVT